MNEFAELGHAVIRKLRLGTALDSIIVLILLVTLPCFWIFYVTHFWPILFFAFLPVLYFFRSYEFLMKNHPNFLRSEQHEERMLSLSVGLGQKGKEFSELALGEISAKTAIKTTNKPQKNPELIKRERK